MSMFGASFKWEIGPNGSSGASTLVMDQRGTRDCERFTFYLQTSAGATATLGLEVSRSSTSPFVRMGSTVYILGAAELQIVQLTGPLAAIRPYLIGPPTDTAAVVTIELEAN